MVAACFAVWLVFGPLGFLYDHAGYMAHLVITVLFPVVGLGFFVAMRAFNHTPDRRIERQVAQVEAMNPRERQEELQRVLAQLERRSRNLSRREQEDIEMLRLLIQGDEHDGAADLP